MMMLIIKMMKMMKQRGGGYQLTLGSAMATGGHLWKETSKNQATHAVDQSRCKYSRGEVGGKASTCRKASLELIRPLSPHHRTGVAGAPHSPFVQFQSALHGAREVIAAGWRWCACSCTELGEQKPTLPHSIYSLIHSPGTSVPCTPEAPGAQQSLGGDGS